MTITEAIALEHTTLSRVFDEVDRVLPEARTVAEVGGLTTFVEGLLKGHAELEIKFGFAAADRALRRKGRVTTLREHHREVGEWVRQVGVARTSEEARRLLRTGMLAARAHFLDEERSLFPAMEQALGLRLSTGLGEAFKKSARKGKQQGRQQAGLGR